MKIELVQLAGRDGDSVYNLGRVLEAITTCAEDTDLLVFPETCLTGFVGAEQLPLCAEPLRRAERAGGAAGGSPAQGGGGHRITDCP